MGIRVTQNNYFIKSRQKDYKINLVQKTGLYSVRQLQLVAGSAVSAPSNQPTLLTFTNVTATSFDVSFTASVGGADVYLAVRRTSASPTYVPVDGTTYNVGDTVGDGEVRHFGAGVSFSESGLTASTTYHYDVFAGNGATGTWKYLTTSPLEDSRQTSPSFSFLNALLFDKINDFVQTGAGAFKYSDGYADLAFSCWIKPTEATMTGTQTIIGNNSNSTPAIGWWFDFLGTTMRYKLAGGGGVSYNAGSLGATWHQVGFTFKGSTYTRLFLDNIQIAENTVGVPATIDLTGVTRAPRIGSKAHADSNIFGGAIDHVCLWQRSDNAAVQSIWGGGTGAEPDATNLEVYCKADGVNPSTVWTDELGLFNGTLISFNFDATSGWILHA